LKTFDSCRVAILTMAAFAFALGAGAQTPPPATATNAETPNELFVTVGKSVLVNSALPIERIAVGFGDFAEATAVSPTEVLVNGKVVGETSLIVWQRGGSKLFFDVSVRPSHFAADTHIDAVRRELRRELPGQEASVTVEGDAVFLRGRVKDVVSADRAMAIASTLGKPVNLLYVDVPAQDEQILIKVKFATVDRSVTRDLGLNFFSTGATNTIGGITTGEFSPPTITRGGSGPAATTTVSVSDALNIFLLRPDLNLGATIRALEGKALVQILAEPNVLALNGKQASFLAGGEFPYPVVQGGGAGTVPTVTIQFREFGVRINFIPTITPRGTIRLQVAPEVSALDFAGGLAFQGTRVPAVTVRRVSTEVELNDGQSFAIGGLIDNRTTEILQKIPLLGDIPLFGKLFRSMSRNRENTELLILITPELVHPIPVGAPTPRVNFPAEFLPPTPGTVVRTPGVNVTGMGVVTPPIKTIPLETMMESLKPEKPLVQGTGQAGFSNTASAPIQFIAVPTPVAPAAAPAAAPK
jgi:pilus assembly protein CpaC